MDLSLSKKRVFISASSDGIGREIADVFLSEGAIVAINGRNEEKLLNTKESLGNRYGTDKVVAVLGDMSNEKDIDAAVSKLVDIWGGIDIVVCNLGNGKPLSSPYDINEWKRMADVNLLSAVQLIDRCKDYLYGNSGSNIVMLSSLAAFDKIGAPPAYAAMKAGINSLVKYLSDDFATLGIRVNGVAPGNVFYKGGRWEELLKQDENKVTDYIENNVPLKRFANTREIADVVVFLASERASFVTGEVIKVDGGQSRGYV